MFVTTIGIYFLTVFQSKDKVLDEQQNTLDKFGICYVEGEICICCNQVYDWWLRNVLYVENVDVHC